MRKLFWMLIVFFSCSIGFAQDTPLQTYKLKDGRDWIQMSRDAKIAFIMGLSDLQAYHFLKKDVEVDVADLKKVSFSTYLAQFMPFEHSLNDEVNWLDQFYWDGLNTNIPVIVALRIASLKFGLGPEEAVDKVIEEARRGNYEF